MIAHVDRMLRHLLISGVAGIDAETQVRFQPPDDTWKQYVATLERDAVNVYLVELRENRGLRSVERTHRLVDGELRTGVPPRRADLHYLITAWSAAAVTPAVEPTVDEHDLLYRVAAVLCEAEPVVPKRVYGAAGLPADFPPALAEAELPAVVMPGEGFAKYAEFWGTMAGTHPWRPAIYLRLTIPVEFGTRATAVPATTVVTRVADEELITFGGTVVDAAGEPVPHARVRLERPDGTGIGAVESDEDGRYLFQGLAPGDYRVRASAAGLAERVVATRLPDHGDAYRLILT
ncbi:Pvc16 family protein [Lentzea sp. NPDC058450]|uniref:Pvc16 family protein n=1 Tax=Lentzea sp. NPDC058450 TaxID=3346505 RepID=UPI00365EF9CF